MSVLFFILSAYIVIFSLHAKTSLLKFRIRTEALSVHIFLNFCSIKIGFIVFLIVYPSYFPSSSVVCKGIIEPCHEKTNILVSDLVRHKPGCTATEDGYRLEILDSESREIVLST